MEIIISAFIGALSAIVVALINKKKDDKDKEKVVQTLVNQLNVNNKNIYILDTKKDKNSFKFESKGSGNTKLIIIK